LSYAASVRRPEAPEETERGYDQPRTSILPSTAVAARVNADPAVR
jgi:hypothetical protein